MLCYYSIFGVKFHQLLQGLCSSFAARMFGLESNKEYVQNQEKSGIPSGMQEKFLLCNALFSENDHSYAMRKIASYLPKAPMKYGHSNIRTLTFLLVVFLSHWRGNSQALAKSASNYFKNEKKCNVAAKRDSTPRHSGSKLWQFCICVWNDNVSALFRWHISTWQILLHIIIATFGGRCHKCCWSFASKPSEGSHWHI